MIYLDEQLRTIAGWSKDDLQLHSIVDNNRQAQIFDIFTDPELLLVFSFRAFLECMLEQVQNERSPNNENLTWEEALRPNKVSVTSVSLKNWLNMWSRLLSG